MLSGDSTQGRLSVIRLDGSALERLATTHELGMRRSVMQQATSGGSSRNV